MGNVYTNFGFSVAICSCFK